MTECIQRKKKEKKKRIEKRRKKFFLSWRTHLMTIYIHKGRGRWESKRRWQKKMSSFLAFFRFVVEVSLYIPGTDVANALLATWHWIIITIVISWIFFILHFLQRFFFLPPPRYFMLVCALELGKKVNLIIFLRK